VGTITRAWQGEIGSLDLLGVIRWTGRRLEIEGRLGARPYAQDSVNDGDSFTGVYGELTVVAPLNSWIAVSASGGKYPSDVVRRVLGAQYVSAGLQLRPFGKPGRSVPIYTTGVLGGRRLPTEENGARLEIEGLGEQRTLRVHATGASSVELMGDFTDWIPVRLNEVSPGVWEAQLPLTAGIHRVNLRLNGGAWSVPAGLRVDRTDFGEAVGILVVP
jgi:hypothetical protein